jgi:hypothetical protein
MSRRRATLIAILVTMAAYGVVAWLVLGIDIPAGTPTGETSWLRPFRVVATLGFAVASSLHVPHVAGQLLAAILLGGLLGAVFSTTRRWLQ